jgi:nitrogen fixation NifU-like protein
MSMMYSRKVMDHFKNPRNMGEMKDPDGVGRVGNPICGDVMHIYIKVGSKSGEEIIEGIKFQTFGCVSAIATTSMTTQLAKGMTLEKARKITRKDVADALDGLPPIKVHCSNLASEALHAAIDDYYAKGGSKTKKNKSGKDKK